MLFYEIRLKSFPKIKYNCSVSAEKYNVKLQKKQGLLEFLFIERGELICKTERETIALEEGNLYPILFDNEIELYSESRKGVRLSSVCVEADFDLQIIESNALTESEIQTLMTNMLGAESFLLPVGALSSIQLDWLSSYIKKIVAISAGERVGEEAKAISLWLELVSRITKSSMSMLAYDMTALPTSAVAYSEMVVAYVIKNYKRKITVTEIAEEFGLSPNYLHAIFKQVKGLTIVDYLTNYRMELAKLYIDRFGLRAKEAALSVGIDDPAYFSRLFKKMYGVSINEYKKGER